MNTQILAHRGHHLGGCRENTIGAFVEAQIMGADGIETDLRETSDRQLVLYHDDTVKGVPVEDMTLDQLRMVTGVRVPVIEELLERDWRYRINLEIKTRESWALLQPHVKHLPQRTLITSFIHDIALDAARQGCDAGLLTASAPLEPPFVARPGLMTCVMDAKVIDAQTADAWTCAGWTIGTYATQGEVRHRHAFGVGAGIVITDDVAQAMRIRDEFHPENCVATRTCAG